MAGPKKPGAIRTVDGELYRATVLRVVEWDSDKSPRRFELVRDDETVDLKGGEQFWIVYAPASALRRRH